MKESILSIIKWHEETFGDAETLDGQWAKFLEEKQEWLDSDCTDIMELADCFIVAAGLGRFSTLLAASCLEETLTELAVTEFTQADLKIAIEKKMDILRTRKWKAQNGSFQHVGDKEE